MTHPQLVMIPALGADSRLWQPVIDELGAEFDCTVIRGEGRTIQAMADHVLSKAPKEFILIGISMGGYVSLEIALRNTGRVKALALFNTSAIAAPEDRRKNSIDLISLVESGGFRTAMDRTTSAVSRGIPEIQRVVAAMTEDLGARVFVDQQRAVIDRSDRRAELNTITCPTIVVGGTEDIITPPDLSEDLVRRLPDARLVLVKGSGHFTPLEQPAAAAAALADFVRAQTERADQDDRKIAIT
ncbi:alpha/beta fold hydrolase [Arthrobacter sp. 2RAF6]|uniref:alpha/beta fold hydrolase n=1 Tax=Arthrobacter sp. 2RAF6 TaxID=3233002 RepID=UPI003F931DA5